MLTSQLTKEISNEPKAYDILEDKLTNLIVPKVLVVSSKKAKMACGLNNLTPAEFLAPFVTNFKFLGVSGEYSVEENNLNIPIKFPRVRMVDLEEWTPLDPETLESQFSLALKRMEPSSQDLEMSSVKDETVERVLSTYGWEINKQVFTHFLDSLYSEHEFRSLNLCSMVLYMVTTTEDQGEGVLEALIRENLKAIRTATGEDRIEKNVPMIVVLVHDALENKTTKGIKRNVQNQSLNAVTEKYRDAGKLLININDTDGTESDITESYGNPWNKEVFPIKRKLKSFENSEGVHVDLNAANLPRGKHISFALSSTYEKQMTEVFEKGIYMNMLNVFNGIREEAHNQKKIVKKGSFLGISLFKKEEKPIFGLDSKEG